MKNILLPILLLLTLTVEAQEASNNEIVIKKDGFIDPQFVINKEKMGFWLVGKEYAKNYQIDTNKITLKSPVKGFITKINDTTFVSVSLIYNNVYITHDNGKNWLLYFEKPIKTYSSFTFIDENNIIFVDRNSNIIKSNDKGKTWSSILIPNDGVKNISSKIYFKNINDGIFYRKYVNYNIDNHAIIIHELFYTNDGGKTWSLSDNKNVHNIWKIHSENNDYFILSLDGSIYKSIDNGNKWKLFNTVSYKKAVYKDLDNGIKVDEESFKPFILYVIY